MYFLPLTFFYCVLNVFFAEPGPEYPPSSPVKVATSITANPSTASEPGAINILLQSKDNGQTWEDISDGLPENEQPEDFFAGKPGVYMRVKNTMYHRNLKTLVWEKERALDPQITSIAFNHSGVMAYNYEGQVYQKKSTAENWLPIYTNFNKHLVRTIFETSDGVVLIGCENGLYKSTDKGQSWKQVQGEGGGDIVESEGVLIGTGQNGIMRSTDKGEHWEWVISEGGVGIYVEHINGGFAAISYNTKTSSRRIHISLDRGKTWTAIDEGLPPALSISSIKQMGKYLIVGHPDGIFRSSDMGKTWNNVYPGGYSAFKLPLKTLNNGSVFKLYVSGNILYAVAKGSGC